MKKCTVIGMLLALSIGMTAAEVTSLGELKNVGQEATTLVLGEGYAVQVTLVSADGSTAYLWDGNDGFAATNLPSLMPGLSEGCIIRGGRIDFGMYNPYADYGYDIPSLYRFGALSASGYEVDDDPDKPIAPKVMALSELTEDNQCDYLKLKGHVVGRDGSTVFYLFTDGTTTINIKSDSYGMDALDAYIDREGCYTGIYKYASNRYYLDVCPADFFREAEDGFTSLKDLKGVSSGEATLVVKGGYAVQVVRTSGTNAYLWDGQYGYYARDVLSVIPELAAGSTLTAGRLEFGMINPYADYGYEIPSTYYFGVTAASDVTVADDYAPIPPMPMALSDLSEANLHDYITVSGHVSGRDGGSIFYLFTDGTTSINMRTEAAGLDYLDAYIDVEGDYTGIYKYASNRYYLDVDPSNGITTGIGSVALDEAAAGQVYNLLGQKVGTRLPAGLYISNGKKMLRR